MVTKKPTPEGYALIFRMLKSIRGELNQTSCDIGIRMGVSKAPFILVNQVERKVWECLEATLEQLKKDYPEISDYEAQEFRDYENIIPECLKGKK